MGSAESKQTIVLVEDDDGLRQALARVLAGAGHPVKTFKCAEDLVTLLPPTAGWDCGGILVCDVRLPGISGFELLRRIAGHGASPPCIFITAYDSLAVREQATRLHCAYLVKPFDTASLLERIEQAASA